MSEPIRKLKTGIITYSVCADIQNDYILIHRNNTVKTLDLTDINVPLNVTQMLDRLKDDIKRDYLGTRYEEERHNIRIIIDNIVWINVSTLDFEED